MRTAELAFLKSPEAQELLQQAASLPAALHTRMDVLRKRCSPELAAAIALTLDLRRRGREKFSRADSMLFTAEGLEQASGERIARWRASRFPTGASVLDLCCGIGGDSAQLGLRGPVLAFDRNPPAAYCAAANAATYGAAVSAACADVTRLDLKGDAAFFDPSRRVSGRRVRRGEDYSPPLAFLAEIRRRISAVAVKVAPSLTDEEMESFGGEVTFVSDSGECKEAVLWFGSLAANACRSAVILPAGVELKHNPDVSLPGLSLPREWLFEPNPAVIRAHLIAEAAAEIEGFLMDPQIAYLTADTAGPTTFGSWYRIVDSLPFNLSRIRKRLRVLDAKLIAVKRRGVPMEPEEIARKLKSSGSRPMVLVLTRVSEVLTALLCEPKSSAGDGR